METPNRSSVIGHRTVASPTLGRDPMLPRPFRVTAVRRETRDTVTLWLVPVNSPNPAPDLASGEQRVDADAGNSSDAHEPSGFAFAPGQFNMLYAFGVGEVPISISGHSEEPDTLVHTIRDVGPVTRALCAVKRGDIIGVRGPFGSVWPVDQAKGDDILLIAGGIGLAPLRPVFYHLLAHRRDYGRLTLVYGARTPGDLLYRAELEHWRGQFGLDVEVTVDAATADWFGPVGVVTRLLGRARFDPFDTTAMICGPEIMIRFSVRELEKFGLGRDRVFVSMERNMKCAIGFCGHCQFVPYFMCKDGPVFRYSDVDWLIPIQEA